MRSDFVLLNKYYWSQTLKFTNSAEEKWALLDKDIEMEDSETENENRNGRTILHHTIQENFEIRLPGTTGIDNLPIPLTMTLS